jgi:hypothetical protein
MRFSIRDLLWLTIVVALSATVYTERLRMQRQAGRFAEEKARLKIDYNTKIDAERIRVEGLRQQNILLRNQIVQSLERERDLEKFYAEREKAANRPLSRSIRFPARAASSAAEEN